MNIPLSPYVPENMVSRDRFSRPVPRRPAHLHTQAASGTYLRDSSRVPWRRPIMKPPYAIGSVPSLTGHGIAYRWRSLPRVLRYRASKPQGSSDQVLPWQVTMDQLICASLSHTHYWYEVGMLKYRQNNTVYGHTYSKCMGQPGKVASPARCQLNTGKLNISLSSFVPEKLVSRDGFGSPVPRQPAHLHTQAESGAYLRDSSRVPRRRPFIHL